MTDHVYRWTLRPETGLALELRITAPSAIVARREMTRFLAEHDGSTWIVEQVSRESATVAHGVMFATGGRAA